MCATTPFEGSAKMRKVMAWRKMRVKSDSGREAAEAMAAKVEVEPGGKEEAREKRCIAWMLTQALKCSGISQRAGLGFGMGRGGVAH